jgi:LPXTG-motif cell wall-anchored protein
VLTVTTTPAEVKSLVKVHLATVAGAPLVGQTVTVSANGIDLTAKTDTSGDAETTVTTPTKDTTVLATYTGVLPAGTVLVPASAGSQKVITTTAAKITRTASATLTGAAVPMAPPTPTPSATASPKPSATPSTVPSKAPTTPSAAPKQLPYTGTWVTLPLVLGVAAVAALGWYLRRRSTA